MSPEQLEGSHQLTAQTDLYPVGVILHELLVGERPHEWLDQDELLAKMKSGKLEHLDRHAESIDPELARITRKCLEYDLASRYQSAETLAADLKRWFDSQTILSVSPTVRVRDVPAEPTVPPKQPSEEPRDRFLTRRQALVCLGLPIPAIFAAGVYLVREKKPEPILSPLEKIHEELRTTGKVVLIDKNPELRWSDEVLGKPVYTTRDTGDVFGIQAGANICMLELLRGISLASYLVTAEISLSLDSKGYGGVYVGRSEHQLEDGTCQCSVAMNFSYASGAGPQKKESRFFLQVMFCGGVPKMNHLAPLIDPEQVWPESDDFPWRKVELLLGPDRIDSMVSGKTPTLRGMGRARFQEMAGRLTRGNKHLHGVVPTFAPEEGLGLYVKEGTLTCRRLAVEKIRG
jgi:hypothetical protein